MINNKLISKNTAYTSNSGELYDTSYINGLNDLVVKRTITGSENLNNITTPGVYFVSGTPTNSPYYNGIMIVFGFDAGSSWLKQIIFRCGTINSNDQQTAFRTYFNGSWSNWHTFTVS